MTHTGITWDAQNVKDGNDIIKLANGADIIAVDEAFMIPGCGEALISLFKKGKSIYVSSIQLSADAQPFAEIQLMFPWATKIEKLSAVCVVCNKDAFYTYKKQTGGDEIEVGGGELYEPRCSRCHPLIINSES